MLSVIELQSLHERVAVVSGGAGHIGIAVAETLLELGAIVVLLDKDKTRADSFLMQLPEEKSARISFKACDLTNSVEIESISGEILSEFNSVSVLVNAAGLVGTSERSGWITAFEKQELDPWNEALQVNLTSIFLLVKCFSSSLKTARGGTIVNIGSIYGAVGPDWRLYQGTSLGSPAGYAASKGGVRALTNWLAATLAPEVRVNLISPGGIWRDQDETFVKRYIANTPLERMGSEQDLKGAIAYFASDLSKYVTGQELFVDGGWTVR